MDRIQSKLSADESRRVARDINQSTNIKTVCFEAGEPTLYLDTIVDIQSQINRSGIQFTMVTNGFWHRKADEILNTIRINKVIISFDDFHAKFISLGQIQKLVKKLKAKNIGVKIRSVYSNREDLLRYSKMALELDVVLETGRLSLGGRAKNLETERTYVSNLSPQANYYTQSACPAFYSDDSTGITYVPQKGYSICCGELLFNQDHNHISASSIQEALNLNFTKTLKNSTQSEIFTELGLNPKAVDATTRCDTCTFLHSTDNEFQKSLFNVVSDVKKNQETYLESNQDFPLHWLNSLKESYQIQRLLGQPKQSHHLPLKAKCNTKESQSKQYTYRITAKESTIKP